MHDLQKHFAIILFSTSFKDILFLLSQSLCFCSKKKSSKKKYFILYIFSPYCYSSDSPRFSSVFFFFSWHVSSLSVCCRYVYSLSLSCFCLFLNHLYLLRRHFPCFVLCFLFFRDSSLFLILIFFYQSSFWSSSKNRFVFNVFPDFYHTVFSCMIFKNILPFVCVFKLFLKNIFSIFLFLLKRI